MLFEQLTITAISQVNICFLFFRRTAYTDKIENTELKHQTTVVWLLKIIFVNKHHQICVETSVHAAEQIRSAFWCTTVCDVNGNNYLNIGIE